MGVIALDEFKEECRGYLEGWWSEMKWGEGKWVEDEIDEKERMECVVCSFEIAEWTIGKSK